MSKAESDVRPAGSEASYGQPSGGPAKGEIGFVGLGQMGTAMAANLIAAGHRVIGYVRRPEQMSRLVALGLKATTDIGELFHRGVVISMLPDDNAVRESCLVARISALVVSPRGASPERFISR
jgi:lactate dehydrogenase-like 2-hydroxyacid dehydrogenase